MRARMSLHLTMFLFRYIAENFLWLSALQDAENQRCYSFWRGCKNPKRDRCSLILRNLNSIMQWCFNLLAYFRGSRFVTTSDLVWICGPKLHRATMSMVDKLIR